MNSGPYTTQEAHQLNIEGTQTGGCFKCIEEAKAIGSTRNWGTAKEMWGKTDPMARTQWKADKLRFIGHRSFCPDHYRKEIEGSRDF